MRNRVTTGELSLSTERRGTYLLFIESGSLLWLFLRSFFAYTLLPGVKTWQILASIKYLKVTHTIKYEADTLRLLIFNPYRSSIFFLNHLRSLLIYLSVPNDFFLPLLILFHFFHTVKVIFSSKKTTRMTAMYWLRGWLCQSELLLLIFESNFDIHSTLHGCATLNLPLF